MSVYHFWYSEKATEVPSRGGYYCDHEPIISRVRIKGKKFVRYTECRRDIKEPFGNWDDAIYLGYIPYLKYWKLTTHTKT